MFVAVASVPVRWPASPAGAEKSIQNLNHWMARISAPVYCVAVAEYYPAAYAIAGIIIPLTFTGKILP